MSADSRQPAHHHVLRDQFSSYWTGAPPPKKSGHFVGADATVPGGSIPQYLPHRHGDTSIQQWFPHALDRPSTSHDASSSPEQNHTPTSGPPTLCRTPASSHPKNDRAQSGKSPACVLSSGCTKSYRGGGGGGDEPPGSNRPTVQGSTSRSGPSCQQPSNTGGDSSRSVPSCQQPSNTGGDSSRSGPSCQQPSNTGGDSSWPREGKEKANSEDTRNCSKGTASVLPADGIACPVVSKAKRVDASLEECRKTFTTEQEAM